MALTRTTRTALQLAVGYAVSALVYIVLSGRVAAGLAKDLDQLELLERYKGTAFVIVTALGLFVATRLVLRRFERASQELLRQERILVANERKVFAGLMAGSVAHDANNVLMGVTSDLAELVEEPATAAETLARLEKSVQRLIALNKRLVQVSRQTLTAQHQTLELSASVQDALELARAHPAVRHATLTFTGVPVTLSAQPVLIAQIVTNLVINAGEATGGKGSIAVSVRTSPEQATLEVSDDGPGVPAPARPTLFEALATSKPDGNGIGLFSVRACALSLGGSVEVTESPSGGACFRVHLPLKPS